MPELKAVALTALRDPDTGTSACMHAVFHLFSNVWLNWEPETIWLELEHLGARVPVGNRQQIMAGRSLLTTGRFWYDATAFEVASIAFSNETPTYFGLEDAPIAFINWAVFEANLIHHDFLQSTIEFDREPIGYTAIQLYREGFVIAPPMLEMAQDELTRRLPKEAAKLANTVREAWAVAPRGQALSDAAYPETPAGVQLARLAAVQVYFDTRLNAREKQLIPFKAGPKGS